MFAMPLLVVFHAFVHILLTKNLAKPQVYTYPAPDQEVATENAFLNWRKSEFLAPGTFPKRDRPPLS